MNHCNNCGRELEDDAVFCGHCGRKCGAGAAKPSLSIALRRLEIVTLAVVCIAVSVLFIVSLIPAAGDNPDEIIEASGRPGEPPVPEYTLPEQDKSNQLKQEVKSNRLTQANRYQDGKLIESAFLYYSEDGFLVEVDTAFIRDDGTGGKHLLKFSCDSQGRMVKSESWYDDFTGEASETVTYEYNEDGHLIQENHIRGNGLIGYILYEYDERGNLWKTSAMNKSGDLESVHLYDAEGKVIKKTIWLPNGDSETYDNVDDPHPDRVEKYPPVTVSWLTTENCASVELLDSVGKTMYGFPIQGSNLVFDENNLLIETKDWSMGVEYAYKFFYNGEIPEDSLAFPSSATDAESPNGGSLRYPISEEDCYIIFRNYYGFDMFDLADEAASVEVSRMGEGDNEMLFFDIQMEILPGEPLETWGFFNVYVNTGVCTGGAEGHSDLWPVFQADDYYY